MYLLYALAPLLQVLTAIHVIKTGRNWYWLFLILFFPMIGSLVYIVIEVVPDLRVGGMRGMFDSVLNTVQPRREEEALQDALELSDTIENRSALADYYLRNGQAQKAVDLYRSCLQGIHKKDSEMILQLGNAQVQAQLYDEGLATLQRLAVEYPNFEPLKRELLMARATEGKGQGGQAVALYEEIIERFGIEEARCRLAMLLEKMGDKERAKAIYQDIVKRTRRLPSHQKRLQRQWIEVAENGMRRLSAS